jgi:hypothetical protein
MTTKKTATKKVTFSHGKLAKEIALDAALRAKPISEYKYGNDIAGQQIKIPVHFDVVAEAEKIYQWLIK